MTWYKKLFVSFSILAASIFAQAQVVDIENATNAGQWGDGSFLLWQCPTTGPVSILPFTIYVGGIPYAGIISCGVPNGSEIDKEPKPKEKEEDYTKKT